jgi:G6PDH family F420-dependent oxidoreductase
MVTFGYKLMSEEHGPAELIANARKAEAAGFAFAAISDHYFPWLAEQGHAPFAWAVLGGLAEATKTLGLMTAVTCPIVRYHPAIVAQAAATLGVMTGNRFTLGLGAGERLNEHVVGAGWPGVAERHERLREAVEIIQGLLGGALSTYSGAHFRLDHAKIFDRPSKKPPVILAAGGEDAAALAAEACDGLIVTEPKRELLAAYRKAGGKGPRYAEVAVCYAASKADAEETAHKYFRWSVAGWPVLAELPHEEAFAAASKHVPVEAVAENVTCGPRVEDYLAAIGKYTKAGCDHIILNQVGPDQDAFFAFFEKKLAPALSGRKKAA